MALEPAYLPRVTAQLRLLVIIQACRGSEFLKKQIEYWTSALGRIGGEEHPLSDFVSELESEMQPWVEELPEVGQILESLAAEPLEVAKSEWEGDEGSGASLLVWGGVEDKHPALRDSVSRWADRWGLRTQWVLDEALQTLARWIKDPDHFGSRIWEFPALDIFDIPPFGPIQGFNPLRESASEFQCRIAAAVKNHTAAARNSFSRQGERLTSPRSEGQVYLWLLKIQSLNRSFYQIAREPGETRDQRSIRSSVEHLAEVLQIRVRRRARGRPTKATP